MEALAPLDLARAEPGHAVVNTRSVPRRARTKFNAVRRTGPSDGRSSSGAGVPDRLPRRTGALLIRESVGGGQSLQPAPRRRSSAKRGRRSAAGVPRAIARKLSTRPRGTRVPSACARPEQKRIQFPEPPLEVRSVAEFRQRPSGALHPEARSAVPGSRHAVERAAKFEVQLEGVFVATIRGALMPHRPRTRAQAPRRVRSTRTTGARTPYARESAPGHRGLEIPDRD